MKVKDESVNIWGLEREMRPAMREVENVWNHNGHEAVITSARDGMHSAGSLHYYGLAIDVRNKYFTETEKKKVFAEIHDILYPLGFDVIEHTTHIHIEFDKK